MEEQGKSFISDVPIVKGVELGTVAALMTMNFCKHRYGIRFFMTHEY
jgi:hypothetical protein